MTKTRTTKLNYRQATALLFYAVSFIFLITTFGLFVDRITSDIDDDDLTDVTGVLLDAPRIDNNDAADSLVMVLGVENEEFNLRQVYGAKYDSLFELRKGAKIKARILPDVIGSDYARFYEVANKEGILVSKESIQENLREFNSYSRKLEIRNLIIVISLALLGTAVLLSRRFFK